MFLSKLEIFGFKSFYNRTILNFNSGITSIVGPNGCGKTNVVDAIRWVLGEQRASVLRSDKMESVIFNGTKKIRPLGMSEVGLTIENVKGHLKTDYSEVTIARRLYRSGESEYLLNKTICRLKDIVELFMDSGLGFNAYSVIELKMIELILNDKTNERRKMFEEAAGITKYKQRRQAALRKLENVQQDLTRVQDIIVEVDKVVRSLERQAKKAEQYNKLTEELKSLEIELIEREFNEITSSILPIKKRLEEIKFAKLKIDNKLSKDEVGYENLRTELLDLEQKVLLANKNLADNNAEIKKIEHNLILQRERLKSLNQSIIRYENENGNLLQEIIELDSLQQRDKSLIEKISQEITSINQEYSEKEHALKSINSELEQMVEELKEETEQKFNIINRISSNKNIRNNIKNKVESIDGRKDGIDSEIDTAKKEISECEEKIDQLKQELKKNEDHVISSEQEFHSKELEKKDLQDAVENLQKKSFEIQSAIGKNISKIDFLKSLIEKNTGLNESVQFLSRKSDWIDRPVTTVTEAVNSDPEHRIAIEAALSEFANFIIVNNIDEAMSGIEILKKTNHGKATFICLDRINKYVYSIPNSSIESGIKASDVIKCDKEYKNLFGLLLRNVFIFKDFESASECAKNHQDICAISLTGEIVGGNGIIRGGSKRLDEGMLIGKKEQIKELLDEVDNLKVELDENQRLLQLRNDHFNSINIKEYADKIVKTRNSLGEIEKRIFELQVKRNSLLSDIEKNTLEKNKLNLEKNTLSNEFDVALPEFTELENELKALEEHLKVLSSNHNMWESTRNLKNKELNDVNIKLVSKRSEIQNLLNEIERSTNNIDNIKKNIERHNQEIIQFKDDIKNIESGNIEQETFLSDLLKKNLLLQTDRDAIQNTYSRKREEVDGIEKNLRTERKEHEESLNEISEMELKYSELRLKAENLGIKAKDEYQIEIQAKLFEDIDSFNFNEAKERVKTIKDKINTVGPVNLLAFSEYKTEKERLDFLVTQKEDLIESEQSLMQTIEEINNTAKQKFDESFEQIRINFITVFKTLFDEGDEADLRFREEIDPLEGEIEIIAKPRGKRPQTIDSLSGGEKTLTAISLLFAIYLVKPSPFCILDEVDAPLDDANVDRFVKILRKFSDKTQFIVVTHNKRTMEAADTLYGVTMEEEGISKVVAVRFNEDFAFIN